MNRKQHKHSYTKFPLYKKTCSASLQHSWPSVVAANGVVGPSWNGAVTAGVSSLPGCSYLDPFGDNELCLERAAAGDIRSQPSDLSRRRVSVSRRICRTDSTLLTVLQQKPRKPVTPPLSKSMRLILSFLEVCSFFLGKGRPDFDGTCQEK